MKLAREKNEKKEEIADFDALQQSCYCFAKHKLV